jgi:hypothetical protein
MALLSYVSESQLYLPERIDREPAIWSEQHDFEISGGQTEVKRAFVHVLEIQNPDVATQWR